ncbi:MAG: DUF4293 family protein [Bacteroidetes bacterium]|nr:MAG: DUF4293 family protein [Bacteroidota bacterium]
MYNFYPTDMIQRIQTVYLFLGFIFAVLFLTFPLGNIDINGMVYVVKSWNIVSADGTEKLDYSGILGVIAMILPFIIMILCIYTTFLYKNRLLQIKLGKINIFLHVILVVSTFFYLDGIKSQFPGEFSYGPAVIFPLLAMVFLLLAGRAIRKDEELVRSADRLR